MSTQVEDAGAVDSEEGPSMMTQSSSTIMTPQPSMMAPARSQRECRTPTKIVAYINIVVNFLHLMFLAVMIILLAIPLSDFKGHLRSTLKKYVPALPEDQEIPKEIDEFLGYIRYVVIACIVVLLLLAVFVLIELLIAVGLLKSTRVGTSPGQAIKKANCWLCCHIILVILNILCMGAFFIMPSKRMDDHLHPQLNEFAAEIPKGKSEGSLDYEAIVAQANATVVTFGQQADGYTIGFGGFNVVLFLIRLFFIFIVYSFLRQLRSIGNSM